MRMGRGYGLDDARRRAARFNFGVRMNPQRIQLSRAKGFNLQQASMLRNGLPCVNVARPSLWGNPFIVGQDGTRAECVRLFKLLLGGYIALTTKATPTAQWDFIDHAKANWKSLKGKNLACWCPAHAECHGDALLEVAARPVCETVSA
jgi:hypothetical protein